MLPLLFLTFAYTVDAGVPSLFQPIKPGVIICVAALVVIASAITPEPAAGSVVSFLEASAALEAASV